MKNKILSLLASLAVIVLFAACDDHKYGSELDRFGRVSFANFGVSVEKSNSEVDSRAVQTVDVSNYIVTITNKETNRAVLNKPYGDLPGVVDLAVGKYTIKVESHKLAKAEFDRPYYMGSQEITVEEDKVCDAGTIICKFASVGVSVTFSEKLTPLLGDDVVVTVSGSNGAKLEYTRDETRTGYFQVVEGSSTLLARITGTVNGKLIEEDNTQVIKEVEAGKIFVLRFKVKGPLEKPEETGTITPGEGVKIDTSVVESDDNNIPGNVDVEEEPLPGGDRPGGEDPDPNKPDEPTPPVGDDDAFDITSTPTINLEGVNDPGLGGEYIVFIDSKNPLTSLKVAIDSESLNADVLGDVGLASEFDLANPGSLEEGLSGLGLPTGESVKGKTHVEFDITQFMSLLGIYSGVHKFILTIEDEAGNTKSITLTFEV